MITPDKHKCLRWTSKIDPTEDRPCRQCGPGPCLFIPSPSRPKKKKSRRSYEKPRRRKLFPVSKSTELFFGTHNESGYLPKRYIQIYSSEAVAGPSTGELPISGCMYQCGVITEINRLPTSNGTQVVHERLFMDISGIDGSGDTFNWYIKCTPPVWREDSYPPDWFSVSGYTRTYIESELIRLLAPQNLFYEDLLPRWLSDELSLAEASAFNAMRPSFKTGFSALNFLYELTDLRDLAPSILKTLGRLKNTVSATLEVMGDLSKKFKARRLPDLNRSTLSQLLDAVAEAKLIKDFGIEPFLGDIDRVCSCITRLDSNVKRWTEGVKALELVRHFKASIETTSEMRDRLTRIVTIPFEGCDIDYECKVTSFDSQANGTPTDHVAYNATMAFTYASKTLGDISPYVAALYTGLGIKPDASIIWNAIPFSFVLDWFVDIQGFLDKYASLDLITSEVTIHSWLNGLRARPVWTCTPVSVTWNPGKTGIYLMPTVTLRGQSYARLVGNPDIEKFVSLNSRTPDGLTLNRGLLSAALLKKLVFR